MAPATVGKEGGWMKPHLVSEIRKGIRDTLVKWHPTARTDGRITEEIMGILLRYIPVEHGNRGQPESELVMVERAEWERLAMTSVERRQLIDERNRLRRMGEIAMDRGISANNSGETRRADRLFSLSDRIHRRRMEIAEELWLRW